MIKPMIAVLLFSWPLMTIAAYYNEHATGWFWDHGDDLFATHTVRRQAPLTLANASARTKAYRQRLDAYRDKALLSGDIQDVKAYIEMQWAMFHKVDVMSRNWALAKIRYPALDYETQFPTSTIGREAYKAAKRHALPAQLQALTQRIGLMLFYDVDCPACQRFVPVIARFAKNYGFELMAMTPDGKHLPELPDTRPDNGLSQLFQVSAFPRLIFVDKHTQQVVGNVVGVVPESEIMARLTRLSESER